MLLLGSSPAAKTVADTITQARDFFFHSWPSDHGCSAPVQVIRDIPVSPQQKLQASRQTDLGSFPSCASFPSMGFFQKRQWERYYEVGRACWSSASRTEVSLPFCRGGLLRRKGGAGSSRALFHDGPMAASKKTFLLL